MLTCPEWRAVEQDRLREMGLWSPWAWRVWIGWKSLAAYADASADADAYANANADAAELKLPRKKGKPTTLAVTRVGAQPQKPTPPPAAPPPPASEPPPLGDDDMPFGPPGEA